MSIIGWVRDFFGIQNDMYKAKKTRLEIEKLEKEGLGGGGRIHITPATMEDIYRYDPKVEMVRRKESEESRRRYQAERPADRVHKASRSGGCLVSSFLALLLATILLIMAW